MDWEEFEKRVLNLPDSIQIELFGNMVDAELEGWGSQINGHYLTLQTFSPEGYHVKFTMFDEEIAKLKCLWNTP